LRILIVDCNLPIGDQLRKIADDTGISIGALFAAWNEQNITQPDTKRNFTFDLIPEKLQEKPMIEKRLSYQAQQRQLPKFFYRGKK
jgi:hypothetical protein